MANIGLFGVNTQSNLLRTTSGGGTVIFSEGFNDSSLSSRGWYDMNGAVTISSSEHQEGAGSLQCSFSNGGFQPSWSILRKLFTPTDTIYVSIWIKYSSNWVGSQQLYHPHELHILSDLENDFDGLSDNFLTTYIEHNYQSGGIPDIAMQDNKSINTGASLFRTGGGTISGTDSVANTENRSIGGANGGVENGFFWENFAFDTSTGYYNDKRLTDGVVRFQPNPGAGYKNDWNHVETYFTMNSIVGGVAQHNGLLKYWFNGTLIHNRSDVLWRTNQHPTLKWKQFVIAPFIGDGSPIAQTAFYDNLVVATGPL